MRKVVLLVLVLLSISGCGGTFEAGIERTPTPAAPPVQTPDRLQPTVDALRTENERLIAALAAQANPATATPPPPDLGRIAYVQGGDIWVKSLPAGQPVRLTSDGRNSEPSWSPSRRWLAFRKDRTVVVEEDCDLSKPQRELCRQSVWQRQLWLVETGQGAAEAVAGTLRQLNQGLTVQAFAWSPTRDRMAYVDVFGRFQVVDSEGGRPATLVGGTESGAVGAIAWSPDGAWIGFEYTRTRPGSTAVEHGLWKISPDGGEPTPLYLVTVAGQSEPRLATWSTTGRDLLFWQEGERSAISADGAPLFRVPSGGGTVPDALPTRLGTAPVLLYPDFIAPAPARADSDAGDLVAVVFGAGQATWQDKRLAQLSAMPASTSPITREDEAAVSPSWSPDGTRLAYSAMPDRAGIVLGEPALPELMLRRIWVSETDTGSRLQLTDSPEYRDEFPLWSRDGRYLLFARLDAGGRASLWVIPAAGGTPLQVVDEITPAPDPLGAFGHIFWPQFFDWTRGTAN